MKAELGQPGGNLARLLGGELNPDPRANDLGALEEVRGLVAQESQEVLGGEFAVVIAGVEVQPGPGGRLVCAGGAEMNRTGSRSLARRTRGDGFVVFHTVFFWG